MHCFLCGIFWNKLLLYNLLLRIFLPTALQVSVLLPVSLETVCAWICIHPFMILQLCYWLSRKKLWLYFSSLIHILYKSRAKRG
jgi:hypothetical protein